MTPFWIVNFLEKDSCESFFNTYWNAVLQKFPENRPPLKYFHITDGKADALTMEMLEEMARTRLAADTENEDRLIPAFTKKDGNKVNVIFIGDITQEKTINRFHTWAAYLKQQLLKKRWATLDTPSIYGILLRPETIISTDSMLTPEVRGFLNELNTLERMDINHRPFEKVLFIQAPVKEENREAAETSASIAAYHIARTGGKCFRFFGDKPYYDTGTTAVFFETDVQKGIDAYNLSAILLHDLAVSKDEAFFDAKEAGQFVDENQNFVNSFKLSSIFKNLTNECPQAPDFDISKPPCHPLNLLKIHTVWKEYYNNYIQSMKCNLVNSVKRNLLNFERDFRNKLYENQHRYITLQTDSLQNYVFQMFCDVGYRIRFKHIGLRQCLEVLDLFKVKIKEAYKSDGNKPRQAFELPDQLENAIRTAKASEMTPDKILAELTDCLEHLPVYNMSRLLRATLLGALISVPLSFFLSPLALILLPATVFIDMVRYNSKVSRIESLKDQFVGLKLQQIRERLNEAIEKSIEKTKDEIDQYIKWLRDKKIIWLQDNLSVKGAPNSQFRVSKVFQPILNVGSTSEYELIPAKNIVFDINDRNSLKSGSFGQNPIVENVPNTRLVSEVTGSTIGIFDLIKNDEKTTVQRLVHELMSNDRELEDGENQEVGFQRHEGPTGSKKMLLLLDVSGSMSGDMDSLKDYVRDLEEIGEIAWIAFDDKVVATSREKEIEHLSSGGGTCYIPAINEAIKWVEEDTYSDIILLSDGGPFETVEAIVEVAKKLGQSLNTIAVGVSAAENVLAQIAQKTGGQATTVSNFEEIRYKEKWNSEILPRLEKLDNRYYSFGELMKYTQIEACSEALNHFALKKLEANALTIPLLLSDYICKDGFEEWFDFTSQRNTLTQIAEPQENIFCFTTVGEDKRNVDRMSDNVSKICNAINCNMEMILLDSEPELVVSLMSLRPILHIGDLQWASTMSNKDKTIIKDRISAFIQEGCYYKNIYDEEIKDIS